INSLSISQWQRTNFYYGSFKITFTCFYTHNPSNIICPRMQLHYFTERPMSR
ncbi:hypothetical protein ILUMI_12037, partial [Ignelater luminosus]